MTRVRSQRRLLAAGLAGAIACLVAAGALAQGQVYRYEDTQGRIVYSDKPPPSDAKKAQQKRLGANFIETDQAPLEAQQAADRFPVTLFTFACGEVCQKAEALLNKRGVPFSTVNVEDAANAKRLEALTGELTAPVLQVGDKLVAKGFNEARWTAMLDEAGYPKAQPQRRASAGPRAPEAPPSAVTQTAPPAPPKGTGYPVQ